MSLKSMGPEKRRASIHSLSFNPFFAVLFAFLGGVCVNLFIHFNPECREFGKCTRTLHLDHGEQIQWRNRGTASAVPALPGQGTVQYNLSILLHSGKPASSAVYPSIIPNAANIAPLCYSLASLALQFHLYSFKSIFLDLNSRSQSRKSCHTLWEQSSNVARFTLRATVSAGRGRIRNNSKFVHANIV